MLYELVAFFALQKASAVAAQPGTRCHHNGDGPVDFACDAEYSSADKQEHVGERILERVHADGIEPGVTCEPENLYKPHAHLHNAPINGNQCETEGAFPGELFGRRCRRFAENVFAQVAHHHDEADDAGEYGLECAVAETHEEKRTDGGSGDGGQEELQEYFLVQVAVLHQIDCAAEIPDDKPDAVRAVRDGRGHAEEYHDGQTQRGTAACDAIDEADN